MSLVLNLLNSGSPLRGRYSLSLDLEVEQKNHRLKILQTWKKMYSELQLFTFKREYFINKIKKYIVIQNVNLNSYTQKLHFVTNID